MTELPSGTVTFLFTDIEGSTALLKALGRDRYDEAFATHQRLLRAAFSAHEGQVVETQGDSFFVAFSTTAAAVAAAVDAQRDLAAQAWPDGVQVKVRMGLHTGEPKIGGERYVGIGVHRGARIGAAAHGGQVLLSSTTKELAEEELPAGVSIRDLGVHRLKDIDQPQHIYQLDVDGLQGEFAHLRTLDVELRRKRRRMYVGSALIGVIAAAVAIPVFALGQGGAGSDVVVQGNAVAVIDPHTNRAVDGISVGTRPGEISSGSGSLWVANLDDRSVSRIDPATSSVVRTVPVQDPPTGLAAGAGGVWVVGSDSIHRFLSVRRIDPQFDSVSQPTRIDNVIPDGLGPVATRDDAVWIAPSSGLLSRLDPKTSRIVQALDPKAGPSAVAIGAGAVWVADSDANTVTRVDPTGLLTPIPVGHDPGGIAVGADGVWVTDTLDDAIVRIDPSTRSVTTTIPVGKAPVGVAVGADSVWVANSGDGTVTRIDPASGEKRTIVVGGSPQRLAVADGRVWVTVDLQTVARAQAPSSGGTARLISYQDVDTMDPALSYELFSAQLLSATCAELLNYPDKPGAAGSRLVPEVAESFPTRSADGKTYTYTIRKGFRFSPPSNEPVTAQTFKYTLERSLSPRMKKGPAQGLLGDIVGARAYMAGKAAHVEGVIARGNTLTIRLVAPAPDLVTRLSDLVACAVPLGTPADPNGVRALASAGPYYLESYTPGQSVVLLRNPNYMGNRPHSLERIVLTVGVSLQEALAQVEAGKADYAMNGIPRSAARRLAARYGAGSPAARNGKQQFFVNTLPGVEFFRLNTHRALFRDARLRRAVNYAIDRRALARIGEPGYQLPMHATDDYLLPSMPGFRDVRAYPLTPDVATARRLAGGKRRAAVLYTCNESPCDQIAQIVKANLAAIGIDVQVKAFPMIALYWRLARPSEPFDLAWTAWGADPDPQDILRLLVPYFDDPAYTRRLAAAERLSGPRRYQVYGKLDEDLVRNAAPWAAYANPVMAEFFSARMGCQVFQSGGPVDLAALCIRHR